MGKVTSVNLDEDAVEFFKRENINISAWIRDVMEQRVTGGDVDIVGTRIRQLERDREDHLAAINRIDEELEHLRERRQSQEEVEEVQQSFGEGIIKLSREFDAFRTARRMRRSQAFKRRSEEEN
ncbi:MAG: hypothetical protein RI531_10135, partial [Haloferacaceae archaeon]|nr:hypothetical protein [Haloferacaceae archaeon]